MAKIGLSDGFSLIPEGTLSSKLPGSAIRKPFWQAGNYHADAKRSQAHRTIFPAEN